MKACFLLFVFLCTSSVSYGINQREKAEYYGYDTVEDYRRDRALGLDPRERAMREKAIAELQKEAYLSKANAIEKVLLGIVSFGVGGFNIIRRDFVSGAVAVGNGINQIKDGISEGKEFAQKFGQIREMENELAERGRFRD